MTVSMDKTEDTAAETLPEQERRGPVIDFTAVIAAVLVLGVLVALAAGVSALLGHPWS